MEWLAIQSLLARQVDVVYVHGYGFPAWRGGPMFGWYKNISGADMNALVAYLGSLKPQPFGGKE